jgi:hypothetical protein
MARIIGTAGSAPAAKPVKPRVKKATPKPVRARSTAPPQSPDSRDNNRAARARRPPVRPSPDAQDVTARNKTVRVPTVAGGPVYKVKQRAVDQQVASDVQRQARADVAARRKQAKPHGHGPALNPLAVIHLPSAYVHALAHPNFGGMGVVSGAGGVVGRSAKDAEEMAVTLPSSVAHLASTAVHHPEKVPGELVAPYKQLLKHPIETLNKHPLQTALMVAPAVRMPGRIAGKGLRIAGKQTLTRPAAGLPGTAFKVTRTGSRDAIVRAVQSRTDRKHGAPAVTAKDVQTRVDEFHDMGRHYEQRVENAAARDEKAVAKAKGLNRPDTRVAVQAKLEGARGGARNQLNERFVREFGAIHQVTPQGLIVKPKGATEGVLHGTRAEAQHVANRLNARPASIRTPAKEQVPLEFTVHEAGSAAVPKFGVVPKIATQRLAKHHAVGSGKATMAKVMRRSRGAFTNAVLPLSPKWLAGQGIEAGIRSAVAGAGPLDLMRFGKVVKKLNAVKPGAGDALKMRVTGGHFDLTGPARDFADGKSLADEFRDTSLARPAAAVTKAGSLPPAKAVRTGWAHYTRAVLGGVNGVIEQTARRAMAGQAIKNSPLIEHHIIGLADKAIADAAHGLKGTENQAALGRAVDRMYGKYQKFSPDKRSLLLHWTPFLPWYLNVATFLTKVLPVDHPVQTALLADINAAEEDWRKSHDLSLLRANHVPDFLLGSVPKDGGSLRVAHYTPFGVGSDVTGAVGSLTLPQITGPLLNTLGIDWKGDPLAHGGAHGKPFNQSEKTIRALVTAAEEQIPGLSQAGAISGVTPRYVDKKDPATIKKPGQVLRGYLPTTPTGSGAASSAQQPLTGAAPSRARVRPVRVKPVAAGRTRVKPVRVKPVKVR